MYLTVNNNTHNAYTFKSTRQRVTDELGRVVNCHYANFNRADVSWKDLVMLLRDRFLYLNKVKVNMFGCSDASDGYTFIIYLKKYLGELASKFLPLEASDISTEIIEKAKKGEILLHDKDLQFLKSMEAQDLFVRDYEKPVETMRGIDFYPYKVKPELRKCINFSVKDVRTEAAKNDFSDEVFMFRNGWTFIDLESQNEVVKNLSKHSNPLSLFMIGQSDLFKSNACEFFQRNSFRGIESDVFTRAETDYPSNTIGMPKEKSKFPEFILFEKNQ